jgi:hypothetical protein
MLRRIWISICVLLSFVSASLALSPSEIAVLFNRGIKPTYYANLLTGTLPSSLTFSRAGNATQYDSTGKLTYAPNNVITYSNTFTNAVWTKTNSPTLLAGVTDPFGGTNATRLTSTANNTYLYNAVSIPTAQYLTSIWVRRVSGSGQINLWSVTGGTGPVITPTSTWTQYSTTGLNTTAVYVGVIMATSGDAVEVYAATASAVTYETTPRPQDQVITTSAAYYGPRFDYNPNTLAAVGLLIEGSATNLVTYSNTLTSWNPSGGLAPTGSAGVSPDGTNNAWSIAATSQYYSNSITATATSYTVSAFAKAGTASSIKIGFNAGYNGSTFSLTGAGSVTANDSGFVGTITQLSNGWYRISTTVTATAGTNYGTWTGQGSGTVLLYGFQIENAPYYTSYIPTAASVVTRAADIVQFTGGALTLLQGAQGAVIVQRASEGATNPTANTNIVKGTNSILYRDTTGKLGTTNGTTALLTSGTPTWTSVNRVGLSWSPGNRLLNYTAATAANDNNSAANGGTIYLGSNNGSNAENGWYQSFGIYNQPLANSNFQPRLVVGAPY